MKNAPILLFIILMIMFGFPSYAWSTEFWNDTIIKDGDDYDYVYVHDSPPNTTVVQIIGGYVYDLFALDSSIINIIGGSISDLYAEDSSTLDISGGTIGDVMSYKYSKVNITGGEINVGVQSEGSSIMNISGGSISSAVTVLESSTMNISGGRINDYLIAFDSSRVNIFGYNLEFDPDSLFPSPWGPGYWEGGKVTGQWKDGSDFVINLVDNFGGTGENHTFGHVVLHEIPQHKIIFVDADATGANNGTSCADAYNYLQDALAAANLATKPVETRVAQGIYRPDDFVLSKRPNLGRMESFHLKNGVTIKGGYAGLGEPAPNERDIELYVTILSGDLNGNDVDVNDPVDLFDEPSRAENSFHVVTGIVTDTSAVLDGFTITSGNANGSYPYNEGGGMNSNATLTNCRFIGNAAEYGGGAFSRGTLTGGTLTDCEFIGNFAEHGGGLIAHGKAVNCTFIGNSASTWGGAMSGDAELTDCTFSVNSAGQAGGALLGCGTLTNCIFSGNSAGEIGGAMYSYCYSCEGKVINCTFTGNSAGEYGGAMFLGDESDRQLLNCILWANTAPEGPQIAVDAVYAYGLAISYCNIQGGITDIYGRSDVQWGDGNISGDPCFVWPWYWGPTSYWKFDEKSGITAYDSAGNDHGTIYGDADWATGKVGGALSFDGWNDYVSVEHNPELNITGDITISAWVNLSQCNKYQAIVTKCIGAGRQNNPFDFRTDNYIKPSLAFVRADAIAHERVYSNIKIPLSRWSHVLVRVEDNVPDFYVDGVLSGKYADTVFARTPTGNTNPLLIGSRDDGLDINGLIDEVMIFDRALSGEEIQQLYQNNFGAFGDYHLRPDSPCIDAGDPNYVAEPNETDMDGQPRIIGGRVDMGADEVVIAAVKIKPHALNLGSKGKWIKADCVLPHGFALEDVDTNSPAKIEPVGIESDHIDVSAGEDGLVRVKIAFDRAAFCGAVTDYGAVELTVAGLLTGGQYFYGTDTIKIINDKFRGLVLFSSFWLEASCGKPDWCSGLDVDHNHVLDFKDFAFIAAH